MLVEGPLKLNKSNLGSFLGDFPLRFGGLTLVSTPQTPEVSAVGVAQLER